MRKLGLRENFCCTAPEGAVGMVAMRMVQPGNVRFHQHGCRGWSYIKAPQLVGTVVIRSIESSYTSRISFIPPVLERVCIWIVQITHTHQFLQGVIFGVPSQEALFLLHCLIPLGILGSNGPMSASIKLPDSYRITSFSTLRSVIIWNQKISWPLLTGFRVKETSRYPWIFRASYWFLSLLGSWKNSVLGTCYS